jgi:hypothetical protein
MTNAFVVWRCQHCTAPCSIKIEAASDYAANIALPFPVKDNKCLMNTQTPEWECVKQIDSEDNKDDWDDW